VIIRADDNLIEDVQVVKEGSTLKIGPKPGTSYNLKNVILEADVTMPEFTWADLSGDSHLRGDIEAGDVTFKLSGGIHVTLSGSAWNLTLDVDGGSHANVDANVDASGGSHPWQRQAGCRCQGGFPCQVCWQPHVGHDGQGWLF